MSHKLPGPPSGPFAAVYVDLNSPSADEDGSYAHPYKTIQAALDAKPAPTTALEAAIPWVVHIAPGVYEEDLTIPSTGRTILQGQSFSSLGGGGPARSITHTATTGAFSEANGLLMYFMNVTGDVDIIAAGAVETGLELENCGVDGDVTSTIGTPANSSVDIRDGSIGGSLISQCPAILKGVNVNGDITSYQLEARDSQCDNLTVSDETQLLHRCEVGGNANLADVTRIERTTIGGTLIQAGPLNLIEDTGVSGNATVGAVTTARNVGFGGTLTTTGVCGQFHGCKVASLATFAADGPDFFTCGFEAVTVVDILSRWSDCEITGNFNGPAGSYRADGPTQDISTLTLIPPATLSSVAGPATPAAGADTTAVHVNVAGEINGITTKGSPAAGDMVLIEDSAAGYAKKKAPFSAFGGGGGGTEVPVYGFDNTSTSYAYVAVRETDAAWTGGGFVLVEDSVNTVFIETGNNAGSAPTKVYVDTGGGVSFAHWWSFFSTAISLNRADGSLNIRPVWEQFDMIAQQNPLTFSVDWIPSIGSGLYLAHNGLTHDLIGVRACNSFGIGTPVAAADTDPTVSIGGTTFTAVASGSPGALQFSDEANATPSSPAGVASSLAASINAAAIGVTATAVTGGPFGGTEYVVLDSGGIDVTITGATNITVLEWDNIATAVVLTPGADKS